MTSAALFVLFARIALLTFGGGYAMVPLFQQALVLPNGFMTADEFANLVALAQVTPGPIGLNAATFAGMTQGGLVSAAAASLGATVPSLTVTLVVAVFLKRLAHTKILRALLAGVRPCMVGVIAGAVVFFARTSLWRAGAPCWTGLAIFALVLIARRKTRLGIVPLLAASALLGWAFA